MLRFAFDAITSFSHAPLQAATLLGFAFSLLAFLAIPLTVVARYTDIYERGVPSTIVIILLLGGIQLITVGIIGEYVGRIYDEVKHRPLYVVRERVNVEAPDRRTRRRHAVRIAVLGAGVCGLTAAHRLARAGHAVDVYERWPGLGGQAATLDVGGGHRLERYYHHLFTSDRHIAALYEELGMPDAIEWRPSSVAFFARGALHPFVTPLDLLRFKPLSPPARVRMGAAALALQRFAGDRAPYERITARDVDRAADGAPGLGARCGGRCCAASSASAPTRSRWSGCGASCGCGARSRARTSSRSGSATRARRGSRCSRRSSARSRPAAGAC